MSIKKLILIVLLLLFSADCFAATWYLAPDDASPAGNDSTGDGSSGAPWFTPYKARKSASGVSAGDTVIFKNGTYLYDDGNCTLGYNVDDAGSSGNVITYQAETQGSVTLNMGGHAGFIFHDYGSGDSSYITLDGVTITNYTNGGVVFYSTNIILTNCTISDTGSSGISGAVQCATDSGYLIDSCTIGPNTDIPDIAHGIYIFGGSGTVQDCTFTGNSGNGIQIQAGLAEYTVQNLIIQRNKITESGRHGISVRAYSSGTTDTVYIRNNLIWANSDGYASGYGIAVIEDCTNIYVDNNTVYDNYYGGITHNIDGVADAGTLRNNISVDNDSGTDISAATISQAGLTRSDNLTTDGDEGNGVEGTFTTTDFQSTTSTSDDFLKIDVSNNAIDTGYDLSSTFTDDYFANERTGTWDIGAHEYEAVASTPTISVGAGTTITVGTGTVITVGAN